MALVIEDGTGVAGANRYVNVADAQAWVAARGLAFTGADSVIEQRLLMAMDLIESYRSRFRGSKTLSTNPLQWPRTAAFVDDVELDDDVIPEELRSAQIQLAYEAQTTTLQPSGTGREVLEETVDVITTKYAERGSGIINPNFSKAEAFLRPLLRSGGTQLSTLRI